MREYIVQEIDCGLATKHEIVGELVRCKDCAYQKDCAFAEWLGRNGNGYCSCGERKDDEQES